MAAIADETAEEQRLREEREAIAEMQQLLASRIAPPDSQLPQEAIPAENAGFTNGADGQIQIDTPEGFAPTFNRQMIGDERYQQEVARAQRGSGFLAPEVGIAGGLVTPGYDPAVAESAQRREQAKLAAQAKRFNGVQKYQSLIKNGATPQEAFALAGEDMFFQDTEAFRAQVLKPERVVRPVAHKPQWGKPTAQVADRIRSLDEDEKAQQAVLTRGVTSGGTDRRGRKVETPLTAEQVAAAKANIARLRAEKQQILGAPENNSRVDLTGIDLNRWNNPPARPDVGAKQATAPVEETITITTKEQFDRLPSGSVYTGKDGKKRRKP